MDKFSYLSKKHMLKYCNVKNIVDSSLYVIYKDRLYGLYSYRTETLPFNSLKKYSVEMVIMFEQTVHTRIQTIELFLTEEDFYKMLKTKQEISEEYPEYFV